MKLHYYPETDSLYIDLNSRPSADWREIADGLVADFDVEGNVVGIDIDHASEKLDLKTLEAVANAIEQPVVIEARLKEFDSLFERLENGKRKIAGAA